MGSRSIPGTACYGFRVGRRSEKDLSKLAMFDASSPPGIPAVIFSGIA
jgi:hypothetical protein